MSGLLLLPILLALAAAFDVWRTRASGYWLIPILVFPLLGPLMYFVLIKLPWGDPAFAPPALAAKRAARKQLPLIEVQLGHRRSPALLEEAGEALFALGRPGEAEAYFREATETGARGHHAALGLARALEAQRRHAEAAAVLEPRVAEFPERERPDVALALGRNLDEAGDTARAEAALRAVLERRPSFEARVRLARILHGRGDRGAARELLEEVRRDGAALPASLARDHRPWIAAGRRVARSGRRAALPTSFASAGSPWLKPGALVGLLALAGIVVVVLATSGFLAVPLWHRRARPRASTQRAAQARADLVTLETTMPEPRRTGFDATLDDVDRMLRVRGAIELDVAQFWRLEMALVTPETSTLRATLARFDLTRRFDEFLRAQARLLAVAREALAAERLRPSELVRLVAISDWHYAGHPEAMMMQTFVKDSRRADAFRADLSSETCAALDARTDDLRQFDPMLDILLAGLLSRDTFGDDGER